MDDVFGQINCKLSADSIVMKILRNAMDKAHEKVQSKNGPIEFLHERSTFYELAIILVECGLNIVHDEIEILEGSCDKILRDLTEIRYWLEGRSQDMKCLIAEKDRELMERSENESKLRQALELKERELVDMYEKLEPEILENGAKGDISKLKSSVDQQMWSIKQKLEDEEKCLTDETKKISSNISSPNLSFDFSFNEINNSLGLVEENAFGMDRFTKIILKSELSAPSKNILIRRMSSDIDILKETLDLAFEKMQSAEVLPLEKQWRWGIEKDIESILVKGFVSNIRQSFGAEMNKKVGLLKDNWFRSLSETRTFNDDIHEKPPNMQPHSFTLLARASSEPLPSNASADKLEVDAEFDRINYVTKMVKNHETIIRQNREWNLPRREVLDRNGSASLSKKRSENNGFEKRMPDSFKSLDDLEEWSYDFDDRIEKNDIQETRIIIPIQDTKSDQTSSSVEKLEGERDGLSLQMTLAEDIYQVLFQGIVKDISAELCFKETDGSTRRDVGYLEDSIFQDVIESKLKEDFYVVSLKEMVEALKLENHAYAFESRFREDIYQLPFVEAMRDLQGSEAITQFYYQEGRPPRDSGADNFQTGTLGCNKFEIEEGKNSTKKLDSLLKCLEAEEELMLRANSEIKEHSVNHDLVISNCEEIDERNAIEWLLKDDESTLNSVSEKIEKALKQLYSSKELLAEVYDDLGDGCYPVEQPNNLPNDKWKKSLFLEQNDPSNDALFPIIWYQRVLKNVERIVHENLKSKSIRLDVLNRRVGELVEPVSFIRKRKLLYKKAFVIRCHNLRLAESEVDLLGDQVETLLCLLERIYVALNHNAVVLSDYFENPPSLTEDAERPPSLTEDAAAFSTFTTKNSKIIDGLTVN